MISTLTHPNGAVFSHTRAAWRARGGKASALEGLAFGSYEIDFLRSELRCVGRLVVVQPTPLRVLLFLAEHRDRTVSRRELLDEVWDAAVVCEEALTTAVALARRAVGDTARAQRVIRTQNRRGYRFVAEASLLLPSAAPVPAAAPALAADPQRCTRLSDALERAAAALASAARVLRAHSSR